MVKRISNILILFMFLFITLKAADIDISISSQYDTVGIEEPFNITIKISGNTANLPSINISGFKDFETISTSSSQNFSFVNGKVSVEKDYTYTLIARKAGNYSVGPFTIKYKGKKFQSNSIKIAVKKGIKHKIKRGRSSSINQFNFGFGMPKGYTSKIHNGYTIEFTSEINKKKVIKGEELLLTYKIIRNVSFAANPNIDFPDFQGFWKENLEEKDPYYTTRNGEKYLVNEIQFALFPTKTGKITIPAATLSGYVDTYFIDPFSGSNKKITRKTKPLVINVLPVTGDTANFGGGVGVFNVSDKLMSGQIKVGQPLIRKITISGTGDLPLIQKPFTSYPPSFRVFSSKIKQNINRKNNINGSITFKEMIIPEKPGKYTIPGVHFKYFNEKSKKMITVVTDSLKLIVKGELVTAYGKGEVTSNNSLKLTEKTVHGDSINNYLLYLYFLSIVVFITISVIVFLKKVGIRIPILEKGVEKISSSKKVNQIRKYEAVGEYKKAIRLIKRMYLDKSTVDNEFIKECDKLLFRPNELSADDYDAFKKKFKIL